MKLEAKSMWLLSFAWRNRILKRKQKGKREGRVKEAERGENKCHPIASPFLQYELV